MPAAQSEQRPHGLWVKHVEHRQPSLQTLLSLSFTFLAIQACRSLSKAYKLIECNSCNPRHHGRMSVTACLWLRNCAHSAKPGKLFQWRTHTAAAGNDALQPCTWRPSSGAAIRLRSCHLGRIGLREHSTCDSASCFHRSPVCCTCPSSLAAPLQSKASGHAWHWLLKCMGAPELRKRPRGAISRINSRDLDTCPEVGWRLCS